MQRDFESDVKKILKRDPPTRSLSHPPVGRSSTVTSPVLQSPIEIDPAPHSSRDMSSVQAQQPMPRLIPLECPKDPRVNDRPKDPRFPVRQPIREQGQGRQGLPAPRLPMHRSNSYDADSQSTGQSSRHSSKHRGSPSTGQSSRRSSKHRGSPPPKRHRR